jgi:nitric oxide reductase NorE protein
VSTVPAKRRTIPGEAGLWVFLLSDMTVFAAFFAMLLVVRADQPEMFSASATRLDQGLGAVNTLLLLTSSLLVVLAVGAARRGAAGAARLLDGALLCGASFAVVKGVEWGGELSDGLTPSSNDFFGVYYMLTGIHLLHVLAGLGVLIVLRRQVTRAAGPNLHVIEGGACYWHMVDLLWLVLFPLLYLLG